MFKLVVICSFFAAVAAEPSGLVYQPTVTTYSTVLAPASTTITKQASSVIHPSPLVYSTPLAYTHFIKKRSPSELSVPATYYAPHAYAAAAPLLTTTYTAPSPLIHSAPLISHAVPAVHLIKKRSVAAVSPLSYLSPQTYAAILSPQTYAAAPALPLLKPTTYVASSPLVASAPLVSHPVAYAHLIKKRSASNLLAYSAPLSYSHQSRLDVKTTHAPISTVSYATPIAYSHPVAVSHLF